VDVFSLEREEARVLFDDVRDESRGFHAPERTADQKGGGVQNVTAMTPAALARSQIVVVVVVLGTTLGKKERRSRSSTASLACSSDCFQRVQDKLLG
jgi:hypothetical protein